MSNFSGMWRIVSPKTRKQLYTTVTADAYDPRATDQSSLAAVTWYSQVMRGPGSRLQTYKQYDSMDADIDIARSLDIIAEEMSGKDEKTELPFVIQWQKEDNQDVSDVTIVTVRAALRQWAQVQDLKKRVFSTARCMIKNGDCFFRKTSDTRKWQYIDPSHVAGIEVDEIGTILSYHLKRPQNMQQQGVAAINKNDFIDIVPAAAMIHFTMSDDMGDSAPFGASVLRPIFRVYRQLSMLEDAVIIYRIVRAPERRVFYIDTGNMNQVQVKRYLESVKNELRQKRVPGVSAGGRDTVDGQYDPQCLALDTRVPLLDGRTLTIAELGDEFKAGRTNWVYSCDPVTGEVKPGEITWAGVTRRDAEVIRLTLDNGKTITCTPDHRFPVQGVGPVRADQLTAEMSLVPFNRRYAGDGAVSSTAFHAGYEEIFDVSVKEWRKTHQVVSDNVQLQTKIYKLNEPLAIVHHCDFDKRNNDPRNLAMMGSKDHMLYHADHNRERFAAWGVEQREKVIGALHAGLQLHWDNLDEERIHSDVARAVSIADANKRQGKLKTSRRKSSHANCTAQRLAVSRSIISLLIDKVKLDPTIRRTDLLEWIRSDKAFLDAFRDANSPSKSGRRGTPSWTYLEVIREHLGASVYAEMKLKLLNMNHKIVKIERLENQDTGCITVGESVHAHHTFATEAGVFTNNSLQEDYFFPVSAAGRGSRVETLPGGTEDFGSNLLRQFQEKIFRGLRIPTSYMGAQAGAGTDPQTNDGKVGIAYIEELRFANFISRLQDRLNEVYDQEFKIYLKVCGLRVDDEAFTIKLPDPANFALYRQAALDADLISSFNNIQEVKFLSRRFILKRYLGLTDDEIQMNEVMIKEEKNMADNSKVSIMQQLYDDAVYSNRGTISVDGDAALAGEGGGGSDEFDSNPEAGLLDTDFEDTPPSDESEDQLPAPEAGTPPEAP